MNETFLSRICTLLIKVKIQFSGIISINKTSPTMNELILFSTDKKVAARNTESSIF